MFIKKIQNLIYTKFGGKKYGGYGIEKEGK